MPLNGKFVKSNKQRLKAKYFPIMMRWSLECNLLVVYLLCKPILLFFFLSNVKSSTCLNILNGPKIISIVTCVNWEIPVTRIAWVKRVNKNDQISTFHIKSTLWHDALTAIWSVRNMCQLFFFKLPLKNTDERYMVFNWHYILVLLRKPRVFPKY